jgi:hypothetical protein
MIKGDTARVGSNSRAGKKEGVAQAGIEVLLIKIQH